MKYVGPLLFLSLALLGVWRWRLRGSRVPGFVHALALLGVALGAWMAWLDTTVGEFSWTRGVTEVLVMPLLVYAGFFVYSRPLADGCEADVRPSDEGQ